MLVLANGSLSFETNTAAVAGGPLLTASLVQENGLSKVQITLHSAGTLALLQKLAKTMTSLQVGRSLQKFSQ
jgi:hypothetical protein